MIILTNTQKILENLKLEFRAQPQMNIPVVSGVMNKGIGTGAIRRTTDREEEH